MLWAPAGLGKTMLSLTLALAVAGGGSVFGWTSPRPRRVIYLDGEMHIQDLWDRLKMLAPTIEGLDIKAADANLTVISRQFQGANVRFPDLAQATDQDTVIEHARRVNAELVICDNFSTLAEVPDENEASAMSPVLTFLMRMKQAGHATILVHHSDKTGSNYRGSSKLATTFEAIIGLHRIDGRTVGDGTGFELRFGKLRGKPSAATRDMEITLGEREDGLVWRHGPAASGEMLAVLDAARSGRYRTQRELAAALGMDTTKVSRLKARALKSGETTNAEWGACMEGAAASEENQDF